MIGEDNGLKLILPFHLPTWLMFGQPTLESETFCSFVEGNEGTRWFEESISGTRPTAVSDNLDN